MLGPYPPQRGKQTATLLTTLIACCWGLAAAYLFFESLLISKDGHYGVAALISLVTVWATLERKRWGRLALLGLSLTMVCLFVVSVCMILVLSSTWQPTFKVMQGDMKSVLASYHLTVPSAVMAVALAALTGLWLCRPIVVAEFDLNKRSTLAVAQRFIAVTLVGCWVAAIILSPISNQQSLFPKATAVWNGNRHRVNILGRLSAHNSQQTRRTLGARSQ